MAKTPNKKTLADKIASVLHTTPTTFDPEDDSIDDTRAKVIEEFSEVNDHEEELLSSFRKQNIDLLADVDERYAGKKSSRKNLRDSDDTSGSEDQSEQEFEDSSENGTEQEQEFEETFDSSIDEEDENEDTGSEDAAENSSADDFNHSDDETEDEGNFKHFKETDVSSQVKKGLCIRNQMNMWENLLEIRIQLQKCLMTANRMPQQNIYREIKKESGQEFSDQVSVTKNSVTNLLDKLLLLQKIVVNKYPETKKLSKNKDNNVTKEINDEEIPSDTEEEKSDNDEDGEEEEAPKKKRKLNDLEEQINENHNLYKTYRNSVIQKWNDKTRIAMLKNNANSHSIINHIEHTLSDRSKLIKRTRLKRSEYIILGQESVAENETKSEEVPDENKLIEEYNSEIFDDDDFYHQLLRELIEVKSADITDPIQLSRQWIQLQKLRSKMKRKIDTRATKGRKIRYTVHSKLVNFMAPIDQCLWTDQAKTELFSSLFGKKEYINSS